MDKYIFALALFFTACFEKVAAIFDLSRGSVTPPIITEHHLNAAKMCRNIYSVEDGENFIQSKDSGAQAIVTLDGSRAVVCFRGTDSAQEDWYSNLRLCKVPFLSRKHKNSRLQVHSGFFIGHNSIKDKVYAKLNEIVTSGGCESILFVGHSSGATLAELSAFDYTNNNNMRIEVVTFGSPKIGNAAFAKSFDATVACTRIVNNSDVIPLAPLFSGYYHVGKLVRLRNVNLATTPEVVVSMRETLANFAKLDTKEDHGIDAYIAAMRHLLKKSK